MELISQYLDIKSNMHNTQTLKIKCSFNEFHSQSGIDDGDYVLEFLEADLYWAAISVGKGNFQEIFSVQYYSKYEVQFRIDMVRAFLNLEEEYIKKSKAFYLLDPSEKGVINYFLGMIFSKLIASSGLNVVWLVHLDSYDKNLIEFTKENRKRPDFIGITNNDERIVLESKGWMTKRKDGISNALQQLRAVLSVEEEINILKVASILYEKDKELSLDVIDPAEKGLVKVFSGDSDYLKDYYARVFFLLLDSKETKVLDDCVFVTCKVKCDLLEVGLLRDVYEIIYQMFEGDNSEGYITEKIKKVIFEKEKSLSSIAKKGYLSVGLDGIYVKKL